MTNGHYSINFCLYYLIEFICYDDACHLKRFAESKKRVGLTEQTKQLAALNIVVDKMHMRGHTDKWCKHNCDPNNFPQLEKVKLCLIGTPYTKVISFNFFFNLYDISLYRSL